MKLETYEKMLGEIKAIKSIIFPYTHPYRYHEHPEMFSALDEAKQTIECQILNLSEKRDSAFFKRRIDKKIRYLKLMHLRICNFEVIIDKLRRGLDLHLNRLDALNYLETHLISLIRMEKIDRAFKE
jgi:hypothetical protein